jgi:hypothetical protein
MLPVWQADMAKLVLSAAMPRCRYNAAFNITVTGAQRSSAQLSPWTARHDMGCGGKVSAEPLQHAATALARPHTAQLATHVLELVVICCAAALLVVLYNAAIKITTTGAQALLVVHLLLVLYKVPRRWRHAQHTQHALSILSAHRELSTAHSLQIKSLSATPTPRSVLPVRCTAAGPVRGPPPSCYGVARGGPMGPWQAPFAYYQPGRGSHVAARVMAWWVACWRVQLASADATAWGRMLNVQVGGCVDGGYRLCRLIPKPTAEPSDGVS